MFFHGLLAGEKFNNIKRNFEINFEVSNQINIMGGE